MGLFSKPLQVTSHSQYFRSYIRPAPMSTKDGARTHKWVRISRGTDVDDGGEYTHSIVYTTPNALDSELLHSLTNLAEKT